MFKTTFISSTAAYLLATLGSVVLGFVPGPQSFDLAFIVVFIIGVIAVSAIIGVLAGSIAILMFRPNPRDE